MTDNASVDKITKDAEAGKPDDTDKQAAFKKLYDDISDLQNRDGGAQSDKFKQDLGSLNKQLHDKKLLPSFSITGVEEGPPPAIGTPDDRKDQQGQTVPTILMSDGKPGSDVHRESSLNYADWYSNELAPPSKTQQRILDSSEAAAKSNDYLDKQLWANKHPSPGPDGQPGAADSPDPPGAPYFGGPGGYGCAPSVSEALRRADVFSQDEDQLSVAGVQNALETAHGWKSVYNSKDNQADADNPVATQHLEPGDVICGYRKTGETNDFGGANAHVGIVGKDGMLYNHHVVDGSPKHEEWTKTPISNWSAKGFTGGIVVLRAPDAQ